VHCYYSRVLWAYPSCIFYHPIKKPRHTLPKATSQCAIRSSFSSPSSSYSTAPGTMSCLRSWLLDSRTHVLTSYTSCLLWTKGLKTYGRWQLTRTQIKAIIQINSQGILSRGSQHLAQKGSMSCCQKDTKQKYPSTPGHFGPFSLRSTQQTDRAARGHLHNRFNLLLDQPRAWEQGHVPRQRQVCPPCWIQ
jgi:hypothetical protein